MARLNMSQPNTKEPSVPLIAYIGLMLVLLIITLAAVSLLLGFSPTQWISSVLDRALVTSSAQTTWFITRAAGLLAYLLVWLSTVWGLGVSSKVFDGAVHRAFTYDFHQFISLLSIVFVALHLVVLLFDQYQPFTLAQIFVPFTAPYRPVWVGIGTLGLYLTFLVTITFYIRTWIGQKTFRLIHLASYLAFAGAAIHGLLSGTDSPLASVQMMYLVTAISVVFLTIYRILMIVFNRRRRPVVQRA